MPVFRILRQILSPSAARFASTFRLTDGIDMRVATPTDAPLIRCLLLDHLPREEPTCQSANLGTEDVAPMVEATLERCLKADYSYVFLDHYTGQMAGVTLNYARTRGDRVVVVQSTPKYESLRRVFDLTYTKFWERVPPSINSVFVYEITHIVPAYQRLRIFHSFTAVDIPKRKAQNYDGLVGECMSFGSFRHLHNIGFTCVYISPPEAFVGENGQVIKRADPLPGIAVMFKQLRETCPFLLPNSSPQ